MNTTEVVLIVVCVVMGICFYFAMIYIALGSRRAYLASLRQNENNNKRERDLLKTDLEEMTSSILVCMGPVNQWLWDITSDDPVIKVLRDKIVHHRISVTIVVNEDVEVTESLFLLAKKFPELVHILVSPVQPPVDCRVIDDKIVCIGLYTTHRIKFAKKQDYKSYEQTVIESLPYSDLPMVKFMFSHPVLEGSEAENFTKKRAESSESIGIEKDVAERWAQMTLETLNDTNKMYRIVPQDEGV